MVVIRLSRGGTNKRPFYHVMVADSRRSRDGRFIERIGYFNPIAKGGEKRLEIDIEKINQWVGKGAQLSPRVANLVFSITNPDKAAKKAEKNKAKKATRNAKKKLTAKTAKESGAAEAPKEAPKSEEKK